MPGRYRFMFWNIQNLYEHQVSLPDEVLKDAGGDRDALAAHIASDPEGYAERTAQQEEALARENEARVAEGREPISEDVSAPTKKRLITKSRASLTSSREGARDPNTYRNTLADIVIAADPDILACVELSVGTRDLRTAGTLSREDIEYHHSAVDQLLIELNERSPRLADGSFAWAYATCPINAADISATASPSSSSISQIERLPQETSETKRKRLGMYSMLETYAIFWRRARFEYVAPPNATAEASEEPKMVLLRHAVNNEPIGFEYRYPAGIWLKEVSTRGAADERLCVITYHNSAPGNRPERGFDHMTALREVVQEKCVLIGGDFNITSGESDQCWTEEQLAKMPGYVDLIARAPSSRVSGDRRQLKNDYDKVFAKGCAPRAADESGATGRVINIIDKHFYGDVTIASQISDHLPVIASFELVATSDKRPRSGSDDGAEESKGGEESASKRSRPNPDEGDDDL